jgi:hypothetical protein
MKRHRFYLIAWACLLTGWAGYVLAGRLVAQVVAGRFGSVLMRLGQGNVSDPIPFVQHRLREALWLATLVLLWIAVQGLLDRLIRARLKYTRGVVHGVAGFVGLNLWIYAASNTALFWGAMGVGAGIQLQMQFHFKRILLEENPMSRRAVLVGSSQTRAQINEELLNQRLGTNIWTAKLSYAGVQGYDLLLLERQMKRANPQLVICYLSEGYFYSGSTSATLPCFFQFRDVPDAWRRGGFRYLIGQNIRAGLFGDLLPLFRCRETLAQRFFGFAIINLKQLQYDRSLPPDLAVRARETAAAFQLSAGSDFEKQAFEDFVVRCQQAHRQVILLVGGYNPILAREIDPAIRTDMIRFLDQLKSRYSCVVLVPQTELPEQTPADYEDLTHVNPDMQRRFTANLADQLPKLLSQDQGAR